MAEPSILERIQHWQDAGLIDAPTAERLRADEATQGAVPTRSIGLDLRVSVVEVFAYLGSLLVLAAWYWQVDQIAGRDLDRQLGLFVGTLLPALACALAGLVVRPRADRVGRAAGVLVAAGAVQAGFAGNFLFDLVRPGEPTASLAVGSVVLVTVAVLARTAVPSLATTGAVIGGLAVAGYFVGDWLAARLFTGEPAAPGWVIADEPQAAPVANDLRALLYAVWWLAAAGMGGIVSVLESRTGDDAAARRRVVLARLGSGSVAVIGVFSAFASTPWWMEPLEPVVGVVAVLAVSAVLVGIAARTRASAWLLPAALGILIGLTQCNASYLADSIGFGPALLVEGLVLLGVAAGAEGLRRWMGGRRPPLAGSSPGAIAA